MLMCDKKKFSVNISFSSNCCQGTISGILSVLQISSACQLYLAWLFLQTPLADRIRDSTFAKSRHNPSIILNTALQVAYTNS